MTRGPVQIEQDDFGEGQQGVRGEIGVALVLAADQPVYCLRRRADAG